MAKISQKKFKLACVGSGGIQAAIAKKLDVARSTVTVYLQKHSEMREFVEEAGEIILDVAERNINKKIVDGDESASRWKLERKGKARGYAPKQEMEVRGMVATLTKEERESEIKRLLKR